MVRSHVGATPGAAWLAQGRLPAAPPARLGTLIATPEEIAAAKAQNPILSYVAALAAPDRFTVAVEFLKTAAFVVGGLLIGVAIAETRRRSRD